MKQNSSKQQNLCDQFESAVAKLNIPDIRKQPSPQNARWFLSQGWITSQKHRDYPQARNIAKQLAEL